jgi:hypothetical protein
MPTSRGRVIIYLTLLAVFIIAQPIATQTFGVTETRYGDQNIEQWAGTIGGDLVQAYAKITISGPIVIQSVSIYLQYAGSDGSQCMKFGIYKDDGSGSPAGQSLVAATQNGYCLHGSASWGPAWETWNLLSSDYLTISEPGDYWLCTLAKQTYGSIYHYAYTGDYDYNYGYANYFFAAPYLDGFPTTFSSSPAWEGNAPYSFYVTGVPA